MGDADLDFVPLLREFYGAVHRPPSNLFQFVVWEVLSEHASTARRQFRKRFGMTFVAYARARWYDARNDTDSDPNKAIEFFAAWSKDGGATWSDEIKVSDGASDFSAVDNTHLGEYAGVAWYTSVSGW